MEKERIEYWIKYYKKLMAIGQKECLGEKFCKSVERKLIWLYELV